MAWAGGSSVMPSHQTSPSSVSATFVKIVFSRIDAIAFGIGRLVGARRHAEESGLGIDGVDLAVGRRLDPGDVVTDAGHFPAFVLKLLGRNHHGEVGLAAGAGEGGRDVGLFALGVLDAGDQHVLGQPPLLASQHRSDPQGEALLAQQRVAAVAGAVAPDLPLLGKVHDVLVLGIRAAGPSDVFLPGGQAACRPSAGT